MLHDWVWFPKVNQWDSGLGFIQVNTSCIKEEGVHILLDVQ